MFDRRRKIRAITMAQASLTNGLILYAVNDLFIGPRSHPSLRYSIRQDKRMETQSSSGIIVSTGLGSTGWLKSILAGAQGIPLSPANPRKIPVRPAGFPWESKYLIYTVREPFPSKTSATGIVYGRITPESLLHVVSQTPETGVIFSDGIENDYLQFPSGMEAAISVSDRAGHLVV